MAAWHLWYAVCLAVISCTSAVVLSNEGMSGTEALFASWMSKHKRQYSSQQEYHQHLGHFKESLRTIERLNAAESVNPHGARFHLNKFADRSESEMTMLRGFRAPKSATRDILTRPGAVVGTPLDKVPAAVDWRKHQPSIFPPIKDQASCGDCWSFSVTSNVESANALLLKQPVISLSEQFLTSCDHLCGTFPVSGTNCDAGCAGGFQPTAYEYIMQNGGQPSEDSYPYTAQNGTCQPAQPVLTISGWEFVSRDETDIAAYVAANGPVSIALDAANWKFYQGGVLTSTAVCPVCTDPMALMDHAVNLVGYGTEGSTPYWIIRNSWGSDWGEDGYIRLLRGVGTNTTAGFCCMNLYVVNAFAAGPPGTMMKQRALNNNNTNTALFTVVDKSSH